jgi:hypothetical protein
MLRQAQASALRRITRTNTAATLAKSRNKARVRGPRFATKIGMFLALAAESARCNVAR